jgi:SAM-dependent methyltransferase
MADLQPDRRPERWEHHVLLYEEVFEPLSLAFARKAIEKLRLRVGDGVLDVAAGAGGATLAIAEMGAHASAVDASAAMVARLRRRAGATGLAVEAQVMDGIALDLPDAAFYAALSVFGVILFPDAAKGLREMRRVVRPGGRIAIVTWTQPQRYELAARLREAVLSLGPEPTAPAALPAQLRFAERGAFERLFEEAGLGAVAIEAVEARLNAPSARWWPSGSLLRPAWRRGCQGSVDDAQRPWRLSWRASNTIRARVRSASARSPQSASRRCREAPDQTVSRTLHERVKPDPLTDDHRRATVLTSVKRRATACVGT